MSAAPIADLAPLPAPPRQTQPLRPYQQAAIDAARQAYRDGKRSILIVCPTGGGKCLGRGTPVLRYDGTVVPVEHVRPWDLLMGPDGQPRIVLSTATGVGPLFRIVPVKGEPWICNDVHVLTLVHTETGQIVDIDLPSYMASSGNFKHLHKQFTPSRGVDFPPRDAPAVDPYFLGLWYGDGTKTRAANGSHLRGVEVAKPDLEVFATCEAIAASWGLRVVTRDAERCPIRCLVGDDYDEGGHGRNRLLEAIRDEYGDGSALPVSCLRGSREVREAFLAGLLDSDGYMHRAGFEIIQKRRGWSEGICFLARSLGFRALMAEKIVNGESYWRVSISGDASRIPMRIPRKVAPPRLQKKSATRTGFSVEPIGAGEYFGFELDGDGRFLLGDFTVTHNTRIGVEFVSKALRVGGRVIWFAHRKELLEQARARLLAEGLPRVGVVAPWADPDPGAAVHVASVQTLVARLDAGIKRRHPDEERLQDRLDKCEALRKGATTQGERDAAATAAEAVRAHIVRLVAEVGPSCLPAATIVVFDEAHHYVADTWGLVAAHYASATKLGLTATPERSDGKAMGDLFDCLIPVSSVRELQELGVLAPCITYAPESYSKKDLCAEPAAAYIDRCPGVRAFCFCINVAHAEATAAQFNAAGVRAATIHANTPWKLRAALLSAFKAQDATPLREAGSVEDAPLVLCNVYTLTEGVDVPEAECCILARGCGADGIYLQMVGRVLRAARGKERAVLIDLRGSVHKRGLPEADREYSLEGKAIKLAGEVAPRILCCLTCGAVFGAWSVAKDGSRTCPGCGAAAPVAEQPKVSERPMEVYGTAVPAAERERALFALAEQATEAQYAPGWVSHQYKARFGKWPGKAAVQMALDFARSVTVDSSENTATPPADFSRERDSAERYAAIGRAPEGEWQKMVAEDRGAAQ